MSAIFYENLINQKNFTLRICEEKMFTSLYTFYFTKNHYIVNELDELISNFQSAGLIDHIASKYVGLDLMNKIEPQPPLPFTYNNIKGFFYIFFCGCAFALVSFISEHIFAALIIKRKHSNEVFQRQPCRF